MIGKCTSKIHRKRIDLKFIRDALPNNIFYFVNLSN